MTFFEKLEALKKENIFLQLVFSNFSDYKNLNFNFPIGLIIIFLAIGFPIMVFIINHRKNTVAICIKQLLRHDAIGEDNAKSLSALRLSGMKTLKKMLLAGGQLSAMVKIANYQKPSYDDYIKARKEKKKIEKPDLDSAKIYLTEEGKERADDIAAAGVSSIWKPIIISLVGIIILAVLFVFTPDLLTLLNSSLDKKK